MYHGDDGRNYFDKPLNPVIGETCTGFFKDGTKCYSEQISHHPPVSYFYIVGPNKGYTYYGYGTYEAKAGFNSGKLINRGWREIKFADG